MRTPLPKLPMLQMREPNRAECKQSHWFCTIFCHCYSNQLKEPTANKRKVSWLKLDGVTNEIKLNGISIKCACFPIEVLNRYYFEYARSMFEIPICLMLMSWFSLAAHHTRFVCIKSNFLFRICHHHRRHHRRRTHYYARSIYHSKCTAYGIQWFARIVLSISAHTQMSPNRCLHSMRLACAVFSLVHISLRGTHQNLINRGVIYIIRERRSNLVFFCFVSGVSMSSQHCNEYLKSCGTEFQSQLDSVTCWKCILFQLN